MIRTLTLALAAAATLVAVPALAATTQVSLAGKTASQIRAEVTAAAGKLCAEKYSDSADAAACVAETTSATMRRVMARGAYVYQTASSAD